MKNVHFYKIQIQNFLSIGKPGVELDFNSGINLITGINYDKESRNGVGKSTLIESLYWVLFGTTMRDLKRDQIPNNKNKKDCKVTLYFSIQTTDSSKNYTLIREAKPSRTLLFEDNIDITKSTIAETDQYISHLINATSDVFQNAVIMTANNTLPFMAQKKGDKRKFIEDMLRLGVFGEMSLNIREDMNYEKRMHESAYEKIQIFNKNIKSYEESIVKSTKERQERIDEIEGRISTSKKDIDILRTQIVQQSEKELNDVEDTIKDIQKDTTKLTEDISLQKKAAYKIEFNIEHLKQEVKSLSDTGNICNACKRELDAESIKHTQELISKTLDNIKIQQTKLESLNKLIKDSTTKLDSLNTKLSELLSAKQKQIDIKNKNKELLERIEQHEKWIKYAEVDKQNISNQSDDMNNILNETRSNLTKEQNNISEIQKRMKIIDTSRFVVSEEGVKSHIIKKMLLLLNSKLNFYLNKLEAPCKCFFNEYFEEIITNDSNQECSYFNFSGGERKRIDLAILFMFQDIRRLQSDVAINVSMYDELFDSALDERGSECILNLLKERVEKNKESIYIVSHNKNTVKSGIDNIILLEKKNGFTTLCPQQ